METRPKNNHTNCAFGDVVANVNRTEREPGKVGLERVVGLEHIEPENLHIKSWGNVAEGTSFTKVFREGQTLFGKRRAYQRKVAYAEFDGICSGDILVFESKDPTVLLPELLPFICQTERFFQHALGTSAGSLSPRTSWNALAKYEFPLPPLEEQKRIAEILWAADEAVEKYVEVEHALCIQKQALITKHMPVDVPFRSLRKGIITGVNASKLKDVCKKITDGTHQPPPFSKSGIPFLLISNVSHGEVDWNVSKWITEETYIQLTKATKPEVGDVLYTVVASYGDAVLIEWDHSFSFQRHIAIIKPNRNLLDGQYLCHFLKSVLGRKQAEIYAEGLAQKTITLKSLGQFCIPTPPINVQRTICAELEFIDQSISKCKKSLVTLKEMSAKANNALMSGATNG